MTDTPDSESVPTAVSRTDALFAVLAGLTGVAGSYAVSGFTPRFIVAPIDALVVRLTPGPIVAFVIETVGEPGHLLHLGLSGLIAVGLLGSGAIIGTVTARRTGFTVVGIVIAGAVAWAVAVAITAAPAEAVAVAVPVGVFTGFGTVSVTSPDHDHARRRVLLSGASAVTFLGVALGIGQVTTRDSSREETDDIDAEVSALLAEADRKSLDIAGDVPGLVSTFDEFYNVDIAAFDPDLSAEDWSLTITGEVESDVTLTFEELTNMPTKRQFVTLRCVGEPLNGDKLDNAVWTGTPLKPLLEAADPGGNCGCAMLRAKDDYFVQFPMAALEDGFLAWGMNGESLPKSHGHPVRVLIPGHWGETNVKWLEEIELLDEAMDGYWEQRGWHGTGPVNTVAKLWSDTRLENGNIEVAGHAYAGTRGVDRVEVSVDGGETWHDGELSEPLPGTDVWRQWQFEFEPRGSHEVVVRAVDGEGTVQPKDEAGSFPSGATGWVSKTIS